MMEDILQTILDDENYKLDRDKIMYLVRVFDETEYYMISEYKYIIWLEYIQSIIERRAFKFQCIESRINQTMKFYLNHLIE